VTAAVVGSCRQLRKRKPLLVWRSVADIGWLFGIIDRLDWAGQDSRSRQSEVGDLHHVAGW